MVYLIATLPPSDGRDFRDVVRVSSCDLTEIRESTCRPNVAYQLVEYEKDQLSEAIRQLVGEKKT